MADSEVLIVGGGIAGLSCAVRLKVAGIPCRIFERGDAVGGRVRTDEVEGFLLDRGFQVLLTAYPEAQDLLDYSALNLKKFEAGALVRYRGRFHHFVDPWRKPSKLFATAFSSLASLGDKLKVAKLRSRVCAGTLEDLANRPETSTLEALKRDGFSDGVIERFFRPFLGGIFLEPELTTSSRKFEFVFRMFSTGFAAVPDAGMGQIPAQLAARLPDGTIHLNAAVEKVEPTKVVLSDGTEHTGRAVVLACDQPAAARLLGDEPRPSNDVACLYFAAKSVPIEEPILILNGEGNGPINNVCVPSRVSSAYAPAGQELISVSVLDGSTPDETLVGEVQSQLKDWFGPEAGEWRHLKTYKIPHALPAQTPPALSPVEKPVQRENGLFACGDYLGYASLQGAMKTGRLVAEAIAGSNP